MVSWSIGCPIGLSFGIFILDIYFMKACFWQHDIDGTKWIQHLFLDKIKYIYYIYTIRVRVNGFDCASLRRQCQYSQWRQSSNACPMLQVAAARGGYGGERYEKLEFQKKVEQKFKSLKDTAWQVLRLLSWCATYGCSNFWLFLSCMPVFSVKVYSWRCLVLPITLLLHLHIAECRCDTVNWFHTNCNKRGVYQNRQRVQIWPPAHADVAFGVEEGNSSMKPRHHTSIRFNLLLLICLQWIFEEIRRALTTVN